MHCPCGSTQNYEVCCGIYHRGAVAETPEKLMRSRYSAFALGLVDYLQQTWHPSTRPEIDLQDNPEWVRLEVLASGNQGDKGYVHFRAFYKIAGELGMLAEQSQFVCEDGVWLYLSGEHNV